MISSQNHSLSYSHPVKTLAYSDSIHQLIFNPLQSIGQHHLVRCFRYMGSQSSTQEQPRRHLAHMLRCLFFLQAKFNLCLQGHHIPGTDNITANVLSRNRMDLFSSSNPQVDADPILVPLEWPAFLLDPEVVWTSQRWTNWFETILQHALAPTTQCSYAPAQHRY